MLPRAQAAAAACADTKVMSAVEHRASLLRPRWNGTTFTTPSMPASSSARHTRSREAPCGTPETWTFKRSIAFSQNWLRITKFNPCPCPCQHTVIITLARGKHEREGPFLTENARRNETHAQRQGDSREDKPPEVVWTDPKRGKPTGSDFASPGAQNQ